MVLFQYNHPLSVTPICSQVSVMNTGQCNEMRLYKNPYDVERMCFLAIMF